MCQCILNMSQTITNCHTCKFSHRRKSATKTWRLFSTLTAIHLILLQAAVAGILSKIHTTSPKLTPSHFVAANYKNSYFMIKPLEKRGMSKMLSIYKWDTICESIGQIEANPKHFNVFEDQGKYQYVFCLIKTKEDTSPVNYLVICQIEINTILFIKLP